MVLGIGTGSTFFFREEVFRWLLIPAGGKLSPFPGGLPVFTDPTGALSATFSVAFRGGMIVAYPVAAYSIYTLLRPMLPSRYRRVFIIFAPASYIFFFGGAAFAYYVMMPVMLGFLLNFSEGVAVPLIGVGEYLDLLFSMAFWFGVIFQIPLAMFLLTKMGIISYHRFRTSRRIVSIFAIILSIVVTPTFDGVTMLMMAGPIYVVYEFGLFLSWLAHPEGGNYMFIKTISNAVAWVYRKVKAVVLAPWRVTRWLYRKVVKAIPFHS